jgi:nucleoid-associated protein
VSNTIKNVAIHDLNRTKDGFAVGLGKKNQRITSTMQRVIDDLYSLYNSRSSKSHGIFSTVEEYATTQKNLAEYVKGGLKEFDQLTEKMMETLRVQAALKSASIGGHVFFALFERNAQQILIVAIINDKLGAALTKDFSVSDIRHLDVDGFRFAGRINLTGWQAGDDRYIGFLKGKGDVSEYFRLFLGCDSTVQDRKDTADLVRALKAFADIQQMTGVARDDFLSKAKSICEKAAASNEAIEFEALANELMPKSPEKLLESLTDSDLKLNDGFIPDRRSLGSLVKFRARTKLWSVEFEREALSGGKILYDAKAKTLTFTDLPADLTAELTSETTADG